MDPAVAVVVGLALPGSKDVKELDLLPPEVILERKRKRLERDRRVVGIVLVVVMVGLGVQRFLKVHDAENQVASLQTQITASGPRFRSTTRSSRSGPRSSAWQQSAIPS